MQLEKNLNSLFNCYNFFWTKLHPHRLYSGKYIEGEKFDYLVIMEGKTFCFDAKEVTGSVLYASKIPEHQFNNLIKASKNGAISFFLIYFVQAKKLLFVSPSTILDEGKVTPNTKEIECELKEIINNRRKLCT